MSDTGSSPVSRIRDTYHIHMALAASRLAIIATRIDMARTAEADTRRSHKQCYYASNSTPCALENVRNVQWTTASARRARSSRTIYFPAPPVNQLAFNFFNSSIHTMGSTTNRLVLFLWTPVTHYDMF